MTEPEYMARAIRAGCDGANPDLMCTYPRCTCTYTPAAIRAAAPILMDEAIKGVGT